MLLKISHIKTNQLFLLIYQLLLLIWVSITSIALVPNTILPLIIHEVTPSTTTQAMPIFNSYKCNTSISIPYEKSLVRCASNTTHSSYVALIPNNDDLVDPGRACKFEVAVPVDTKPNWPSNQTIKNVNYTKLLLDGFTIKYKNFKIKS